MLARGRDLRNRWKTSFVEWQWAQWVRRWCRWKVRWWHWSVSMLVNWDAKRREKISFGHFHLIESVKVFWKHFKRINFLNRVQESQKILSREEFDMKFRLLFRKLDEVNLFLMQIIQSFKQIWNKILRSQTNDWWLTNFCTQRIAWISLQTRSKILQDISTRIACLRWQSSMASKILLRRC